MATDFNRMKNCDRRTRNILNGYIREMQKLFQWKTNAYFIIPELINHICLSFYGKSVAFNKKYFGQHLRFVNDMTVIKENYTNRHSLCVIGNAISYKTCDIFRIEYTVKNVDKNKQYCCYLGFLKLKSIDSASFISWDDSPGHGTTNGRVGVEICMYNLDGRDYLSVYQGWQAIHHLKLKNGSRLKHNDAVMLEFDFIKSEWYIYHNDIKLDFAEELDTKDIIPCVSLYYKGEMVEITKYQTLHYKQMNTP